MPHKVSSNLLAARRIAVVGLSDDSSKPSYMIADYLLSRGREVVPVNPMYKSALGLKCYASLEDIAGVIDLVNVFRRPEFCADIVRSTIATGAGGVWLQSGIISEEARQLASAANMPFVQDRCLMVEMRRAGI